MLEGFLEVDLFADWGGEEEVDFPGLTSVGWMEGDTNSTIKSLPMAEMRAIMMYIVRRRGMR